MHCALYIYIYICKIRLLLARFFFVYLYRVLCCYVIHSARERNGVDEDVTPFAAFVSFSSVRLSRPTPPLYIACFWANHTRNRIRAYGGFLLKKNSIHKNNKQDTTQKRRRSVSIFAIIIQRDRQCTAYKILLNSLLSRDEHCITFECILWTQTKKPTMQKFDDVHTHSTDDRIFVFVEPKFRQNEIQTHLYILSKLRYKLSHSTMDWIFFFARQFAHICTSCLC